MVVKTYGNRRVAISRVALRCRLRDPSTVDVTAPPPTERPRPQLPLKLHQAPDSGAVRADVGFDVGGRLADGRQVDAEQLRAPFERGRDRAAEVGVILFPGAHARSLVEHTFEIKY